MNDYISREEVMQKFLRRGDGYITMMTMRDMINEVPAADVQPVKHGRWIMHSDYPDKIICSHCNSARDAYFYERDSMKYCPNCGARMDGDTNG